MENKCNEWTFTILVQQVYTCKRTAAATTTAMGIYVHSVEKVTQEVKNSDAGEGSASYQTPDNKCQCCVKPVHNISDFNTKVIRKTIYNFYIVEKLVPNVLGLQMKLAESIHFHWGNTSLRQIIIQLGFKWGGGGRNQVSTNRKPGHVGEVNVILDRH